MSQTARYKETLRRLAMIDEAFVEDEAGLGLALARTQNLEPKTAALLQLGALVASGSPALCLEWRAGRALAAPRLRTRSPMYCGARPGDRARPRRLAAPDIATALGYDVGAALEDLDDP